MSMTLARSGLCLRFELLNGVGADTNMATADITTGDEIVFAISTLDGDAVCTDQTAAMSIPTDGNVQCTNAIATSNLLLLWNDLTI